MGGSLRGFSLIELMIVVAIIGILSAIAAPIYSQFVVKAQVSRVVGELSVYRNTVEESLADLHSSADSGLEYVQSSLTVAGQGSNIYVSNTDGSGHLQVTLGGNAHPVLHGVIIRMERSASGSWRCVIDKSAASGWKDSYLPNGCSVS